MKFRSTILAFEVRSDVCPCSLPLNSKSSFPFCSIKRVENDSIEQTTALFWHDFARTSTLSFVNEMKSLIASENLPLFSGSHEISCHVCNGKGVLICCDFCPYAYHPSCLQPPMVQRPFDYWVCPACLQDIKSQHKSDIKSRCEEHKDTIPSANPFLQGTSPPPVTIQSFVPTRISSARFPPSSFALSPSLSKPQFQYQYQFQFQFQSHAHSHSHSQLLLLLLLSLYDRNRKHHSERTTFSSHFRGVYNRGTKWNAQIQVRGKKIVCMLSQYNV